MPTYLRRHAPPLGAGAGGAVRRGGPWSIDAHTSTGAGRGPGRRPAAVRSGPRLIEGGPSKAGAVVERP